MEGSSGDITVTSSNRKCSAVTGSARKIKDNAADWHNLLLRWEKLSDEGFAVAGNIANLRLNSSQSDQQQLQQEDERPLQLAGGAAAGGAAAGGAAAGGAAAGGAAAAELQDECCKLQDVFDKMVVLVMKMERLMASQRGVLDLEEFQFGPEGRKVPLFHSWSTKQFEDSSCVLLDAFRQELRLKQTILQELAHTVTSDLCMVYLSCWLHQPFIPPQTRMTLEALLLETGHRPL